MGVPQAHDGSTTFEVRVCFCQSVETSPAVTATNADVTTVAPVGNSGHADRIAITPDSDALVETDVLAVPIVEAMLALVRGPWGGVYRGDCPESRLLERDRELMDRAPSGRLTTGVDGRASMRSDSLGRLYPGISSALNLAGSLPAGVVHRHDVLDVAGETLRRQAEGAKNPANLRRHALQRHAFPVTRRHAQRL